MIRSLNRTQNKAAMDRNIVEKTVQMHGKMKASAAAAAAVPNFN